MDTECVIKIDEILRNLKMLKIFLKHNRQIIVVF